MTLTTFSSFNRTDIANQFKQEQLDVLVIGGGITGAGIALDAVTRGLKTGVVEMQDFAAGTSSRSTKLVHGGLRYLQQFQIRLVAEVGKERAIVYENGPHVTTPEWMLLPFHQGGTFGPFMTNIGLVVYDFLAKVKKHEHRKMLSTEEALKKEPLIKKEGLKGAGYYVEYKTDDARLTIEVMKKAVEQGAHVLNYTKATGLIYDEAGKCRGVKVKDLISHETYEIHAKKVINASGIWLDEIREKDGSKYGKELHLTKGVHLVFSKEVFPLEQAIYFDSPDGRMIFAIPRANKVYVGTTDTYYEGDPVCPEPTKKDRVYLLKAIHRMFPSLNIDMNDIESSWAGIRALFSEKNQDKPSEISRKDEIFVSDSRLISIAGGKLTGYRKMAEDAVDEVVRQFKNEENLLYSSSITKNLPISGGNVDGSKGFERFKNKQLKYAETLGIPKDVAQKLIDRYGGNAPQLFEIYTNNRETAHQENMDPLVLTELIYGIEYELVYKPVDFFIRRTSALLFDIDWVKEHQESVIRYMDRVLQWDDSQKEQSIKELEDALNLAEGKTME